MEIEDSDSTNRLIDSKEHHRQHHERRQRHAVFSEIVDKQTMRSGRNTSGNRRGDDSGGGGGVGGGEESHGALSKGSRVELGFGDDECSTDSGCSSGGSTGSAERLSRRGSAERLFRTGRSPRSQCYLDRFRSRATRSQDRFPTGIQRSSERVTAKSSRSWSPDDTRTVPRTSDTPSYSPSPSDVHSSSDSDSLKRSSTADTLRRAFQSLKISSKWESKEKKHAKKSPKRILRSPVSYTYVKGLSGLPTQRVPRNISSTHQSASMPCACRLDTELGFYR